jgi:hypothetical protein
MVHSVLLACAAATPALAAADAAFDAPRKLEAGGKAIEVEAPGYAAPCLADIDGDSVPDLLVGQFNDGKIAVHKGSRGKDGKLVFAERKWLMAGGEVAVVPGVW